MPQYRVMRGKILHKDVVYHPGTVIELPEEVARGLQQGMVEPVEVPRQATGAPVKMEPQPAPEPEEKKEPEEKTAIGQRKRQRRE